MKRNIVLLLFFVVGTFSALADVTLPKKVAVRKPKSISAAVFSTSVTEALENDKSWGQNEKSQKPWVVFSDRSNNVTYTAPNGQTKYQELEFNEKLYIAQISGDYALVYHEPQPTEFPNTSRTAVSKGWISMKKLLLWSNCPTDKYDILQKALIAQNLNSGKMNENAFAFLNPNMKDKGMAKELRSSMDFYFIMKEDKSTGLSLLATNYELGSDRYMVLYGWVSKSHFIAWSQRSCLEPNWNKEDAEYFKQYNVEAVAYKDMSKNSTPVAKDSYARRKITNDEASMYRKPATHMRYPILEDKGDYYYCTTFAKIDGAALSQSDYDRLNDAPKIIDDAIENTNNINIIVVIDGTKSMGEFYAPMKDAITAANKSFESSKKVRVGAVIYRDKADGKFEIEFRPMTRPDDAQLKKFLEFCGEYGPQKTPGDGAISAPGDDMDEALFKGLNIALDTVKMKYSRNQSNIMFVIGDCGDHDAINANGLTVKQKEIVEKMVNAKVQAFAFQVRNLNQESFAKFVSQMNGIIKDNMIHQYGKLGLKGNWKRNPGGSGIVWDTSDQKYNYYMGGSFQALNGQAMSGPLLTELIQQSFAKTNDHVEKFNNAWQKAVAVYGDTVSDGAKINMALYEDMLTPSQIEALRLRASVIARNGYAPKKDDGDRQYWKLVLYFSQPELQKLISRFKEVVNVGDNIVKERHLFINALENLALAYVGELQTGTVTIDYILKKMSGTIYDESSLSKKYTLKEFGDKEIVSDSEFLSIVDDFKTKYENLVNILNDINYVGRRNPGGQSQPYFWIPGEDMP